MFGEAWRLVIDLTEGSDKIHCGPGLLHTRRGVHILYQIGGYE